MKKQIKKYVTKQPEITSQAKIICKSPFMMVENRERRLNKMSSAKQEGREAVSSYGTRPI